MACHLTSGALKSPSAGPKENKTFPECPFEQAGLTSFGAQGAILFMESSNVKGNLMKLKCNCRRKIYYACAINVTHKTAVFEISFETSQLELHIDGPINTFLPLI